MEIFYHLSHFFEFLTGLYFGSFALLGFLQKDASNSFNRRLENRENNALNAKTQVVEYYEININAGIGPGKVWANSTKWAAWSYLEKRIEKIYKTTNFLITDIISHKGIFIKRFFPVFFYTGIFCLSIVLFSGYESVCFSDSCKKSIDVFFIYYCLSSIIFQCWGLIIFPFLVSKNDYLKLTVINLFICITLFFLTEHFSSNFPLFFGLNYFLIESSKDWFIAGTLIIAMIPLIFILLFCAVVLIFWFISNAFYFLTLWRFQQKNAISSKIQELE